MTDPRNERSTRNARTADALVIFGITGDLARKMTFRSLYRLERRGLLACPIVGVALEDWTVEHLREHARAAIAATGEPVDDAVFARLAARLSYVGGDFGDADTYVRVRETCGGVQSPVFYLEVPPSLFATVIAGLSQAQLLPTQARVVVEKPFGHDLASARALAVELHRYLDESQLLRIDHFLGKIGLDEILYLRFANTMIEPVFNRHHVDAVQVTMAEAFGVQDRGHFYDPVGALRDVVVNHLLQVLAVVTMEPPAGRDPATIKDAKLAVFRAMSDALPSRYVRGQYAGYREIDGVARDSSTETFSALELRIENWRWAGVPFFIRAGKRLPATQTEVRVIFCEPPRLGFVSGPARRPVANELVIRIDPDAGMRLVLDAKLGASAAPREIDLDLEFAELGGDVPTPYEVLLHAAIVGDTTHFTRQDIVEETWRILAPLLDEPPAVQPYAQGSWGPEGAQALTTGHGGWRTPWAGH